MPIRPRYLHTALDAPDARALAEFYRQFLGLHYRAGDEPPAVGERSDARLCARVGCGEAATHTLTADYTDRLMAVGPLSPERTPPALDLCERHSEALTPPEGWQLMRHDPSRE